MSEPTKPPLVIPSLQAVKEYTGRFLGYSSWVEITQDRIDRFAEATGDRQWIHVDPERARRESPFGTTIAHGYLTLSLAPLLIRQIGDIDGYAAVINHGLDKVRLREPVPAGARVRMGARVKSVRDIPRGGIRVVFTLTFEVEGKKKPACSADAIFAYFP